MNPALSQCSADAATIQFFGGVLAAQPPSRSTSKMDPAQIALELVTRSTPSGEAPPRSLIEADYTEDAEQVNGLGRYSAGREAIISTVQKVVGAAKTVGIKNEVVNAALLAERVILAHVLSSAHGSTGPNAGHVKFRFTLVIVRDGDTWKIRSSSTTPVREMGKQ
jgi:uncharacterized protein (TIGR02246 family)